MLAFFNTLSKSSPSCSLAILALFLSLPPLSPPPLPPLPASPSSYVSSSHLSRSSQKKKKSAFNNITLVILCFVTLFKVCVYVKQLGTASALETLCGQAYGAKLYGKLGIQMQRAMFVLLILSVPLSIIWANTEQILVLVHQDKSIASVAGSYAKYMIPSLFAYGLLQCINRFLQAQNNVFPVFVCSGITTCLHLLLCWLFVLKTGLGYRGAALAISVSYWFNVILLSCYVKFSPSCSHSWTGFSKEAFQELYDFSKIAFPSAVMVW